MSMIASRKAHTEIIDWWTLLSESSQVAREIAESVSTEIIGEAAEDAEAAAEDARTAAAGADAAAASISQAISDGIATEAAARESADAAMLESIAAEADRAASAEQANADAIAVLNGTGAGSVSRAVSDGIASVIADAPQSLDTLKEIADWIDGHAGDAAAMNSAIRQNTDSITAEESARQAADTALSEGKQAKALSSPVEFDGVTYTQLEPLLSAVASTAVVESKTGNLSALETTNKTNLVSAINEVNGKAEDNTLNFAPAFSDVTSYAVGDYVTYNGTLYKCTTAHTAGAWVAGHFTQVTVGGESNKIVPSDASENNKLVTNEGLHSHIFNKLFSNSSENMPLVENSSLHIVGVNFNGQSVDVIIVRGWGNNISVKNRGDITYTVTSINDSIVQVTSQGVGTFICQCIYI